MPENNINEGNIAINNVDKNNISNTNQPPKKSNKKKKIIIFGSILSIVGAIVYWFIGLPNANYEEFVCFENSTQLYDKYKGAVVMVKTEYAYFAKIKGKEVQLEIPEGQSSAVTGTGFFIDDKGIIATNLHVIKPWLYSDFTGKDLQNNVNNIRMKISSILTTDILEENYVSFISENWGSAYYGEGGDGYDEGYSTEAAENVAEAAQSSGETFSNPDEMATEITDDIAATIEEKQYVGADEIIVYIRATEISINSHDSGTDSWRPVEVYSVPDSISMDDSEESEHNLKLDIALLKLNDGKTPDAFIPLESFELDDTTMKPGTKSIMLGYPLGLDLASTNDVLKVQMYNGEISKESDAFNIQYSITSTHGASGAPVFNECGKLIAINYGGLDQVQGFNFGIVANQLFEFCR